MQLKFRWNFVKWQLFAPPQKARHNIQYLMQQILQSDPKKVLKRGYAIIKNTNDKIISSKLAAEQEQQLIIEFQDGQIRCDRI